MSAEAPARVSRRLALSAASAAPLEASCGQDTLLAVQQHTSVSRCSPLKKMLPALGTTCRSLSFAPRRRRSCCAGTAESACGLAFEHALPRSRHGRAVVAQGRRRHVARVRGRRASLTGPTLRPWQRRCARPSRMHWRWPARRRPASTASWTCAACTAGSGAGTPPSACGSRRWPRHRRCRRRSFAPRVALHRAAQLARAERGALALAGKDIADLLDCVAASRRCRRELRARATRRRRARVQSSRRSAAEVGAELGAAAVL